MATCGSRQSKPRICSWLRASPCCTSWCTAKQVNTGSGIRGSTHTLKYNKYAIPAEWPNQAHSSFLWLWLVVEDKALGSLFWGKRFKLHVIHLWTLYEVCKVAEAVFTPAMISIWYHSTWFSSYILLFIQCGNASRNSQLSQLKGSLFNRCWVSSGLL